MPGVLAHPGLLGQQTLVPLPPETHRSLHCLQIAIELVLGLDRAWLNPERLEDLRGLFGDWLEGFTSPFALDVSWTGGRTPSCLWMPFWMRAQHAPATPCLHLPVPGLHRGAALSLVCNKGERSPFCNKGVLCRGAVPSICSSRRAVMSSSSDISTSLFLPCSPVQAVMTSPAAQNADRCLERGFLAIVKVSVMQGRP